MSDAPERIWIDEFGGNWSPVSGGTQRHEYIRADKVAALVEAARRAREFIVSGDDRAGPVQRQLDAALAALDAKP